MPTALDACALYLIAHGLNGALTVWYKNYCGYFRPNFFAGCGWNATLHACSHEWLQGRHSFPSGHSSTSATTAIVVTLYMLRTLESWPAQASGQTSTWARRALAVCVPVPAAVAGWVAASRVHDNWHFPADVAAGSALGAACGALIFALMAPLSLAGKDGEVQSALLRAAQRAATHGDGQQSSVVIM